MPLTDFFPVLERVGYTITSPDTPFYNCIAWAAGANDNWWRPDPMGISPWPPTAPRAETIKAFLAVAATDRTGTGRRVGLAAAGPAEQSSQPSENLT